MSVVVHFHIVALLVQSSSKTLDRNCFCDTSSTRDIIQTFSIPKIGRLICSGSFFNIIFSWDRVDPFSSLRTALSDPTNMLLCLCVFLSYLPEAGQYSCFFIYLTQVIGFSVEKVASFIAVIGT